MAKKKKKKKGVIHIGTEYEGDIIKIAHGPKIYDKDGNEIIIHTPPPEMVTDPFW